MNIKMLAGRADKIGFLVLPFIIVGLILNIIFPSEFSVDGPSTPLVIASIVVLVPGLINWVWCVVLILTRVPRKELITGGPYAVVKHPLYVGMALLVLPWVGFLLNSWLGLLLGIVLYIGTRLFARGEEVILAKAFGTQWEEYCKKVLLPWL